MTQATPMDTAALHQADLKHVWHPFTQAATEPAPIAIREARGSRLVMDDGLELVDGISSWWATLHGHGEPALVETMANQARTLDHVMFAGTTHRWAVELAERLCELAPGPLTRAFYSDNGSTAVEVALKAAFLAARRRGDDQRRLFVALDEAYHGDTFGAMAVGAPDPFFRECGDLLCEVLRVPPEAAAASVASS